MEVSPEVQEQVKQRKAINERNADFAFALATVGLLILSALFYLAFPQLAAMVFVSGLLAYALLPLVDRLDRKLPRWLSVMVAALLVLGVLAAAVALAVPLVSDEVKNQGNAVGEVKGLLVSGWEKVKAALPASLRPKADGYLATAVEQAKGFAGERASGWAKKAGSGVAAVASGLVFIPVFVSVMLFAWHRMTRRLVEIIPPRWRPRILARAGELDSAMSGFVRGQLLVALALAVIYSTAFSIIGIPLAVVVGLIAGFGELVPYLGGALALILGSLLALAGGNPVDALWVVGVFAVVQAFEGAVLGPWILGKKAEVRPAAIIIALAIGGELFGLLGLLLAVPTAALLKVASRTAASAYQRTSFYDRHGTPAS